jgi:hypothetical protein
VYIRLLALSYGRIRQPISDIRFVPRSSSGEYGMSSGFTAGFATLLVSILLLAVSCARIEGDETGAGTRTRYSSPKAVFDAFREARGKRDWRKCFSLLTAKAQSDALFESFFACGMHDSKESRAILTKYGLDDATIGDAIRKKYKEKYDIDTADGAEKVALPGDSERDLLVDIVATRVKDKAGFFEAERNLLAKASVSPVSDLEQLVVHNDTATGHAKITWVPTPGESREVSKFDKTFKFRRIDGGWLLDSL